jgi:carboxypeptidase Taq
MLRFEVETDLIGGCFEMDDVLAVWNAKMQDFMGVTPPPTAQGALQDIHWSIGSIG